MSTSEKKHVFISYKSDEFDTANWVRSILETNGISCWMAPRDIPGGSSYAAEIPAAIRSCRVFVVILSQKAQESTWVPKELDIAINHHKIIMPFMLEDFQLRDDFNFYLSNVQRYAAYENKSRAMERMIREIQAILEVYPNSQPIIRQETSKQNKPPSATQQKRIKQWIIISACLTLLICGGIFGRFVLSPTGESRSHSREGTEPAQMAEESLPADLIDQLYHITVIAPERMTVKNFNTAKKILNGRIELFSDGKSYQLEEQEDRLDLFLPVDSFAMETIETALRCYITRAINLYMIDNALDSRVIPISRNDLASVALHTGTIPGVDAASYGVTDPEYQYITMELTDDFVSENKETYEGWEELTFAQDVVEFPDSYARYYTFPSGDSKTFYVLNNDLGGKYSELVVYNLTHESLSESFRFMVDANYQVTWETATEHKSDWGTLQREYQEFTEGTITFTLSSGNISMGELIDECTALKLRLDVLGNPYAFGLSSYGDGYLIAIKTKPDRINQHIIDLMRKSIYPKVRSLTYEDLGLSARSVILKEKESGKYSLQLEGHGADSSNRAKLQATLALSQQVNEEVYFYINDLPLFPMKDVLYHDDTAVIDVANYCFIRDGKITLEPITAENQWYVNYIKTLLETESSMKATLSYDAMQMNPDSQGILPTEEELSPSLYSNASQLENIVRQSWSQASTSYDSGFLSVFLHLSLDDRFISRSVHLTEEIFHALKGKDLYLTEIGFYLIDEEGEERARIFLQRSYLEPQATGEVLPESDTDNFHYYGIMKNGMIDDYRQPMLDALEASEFYQTHRTDYSVIY
ncbi:MAG: toll/interleukin-1 receptor domain-containing protein [Clostridia bacterium]|nr:toll/interleukin-1 receptor domain-containing protein [Clostridia bacterium]